MSFAITGVVIAGIGMVGNAQSSSIQGGASRKAVEEQTKQSKAKQEELNANSELARSIQKINNDRIMRAADKTYAAAATNLSRNRAAVQTSNVMTRIAQAEAAGAYAANVASKGVGGGSVEVIENTMALRDSLKNQLTKDAQGQADYDAVQTLAGIIPAAWQQQDMTVLSGNQSQAAAIPQVTQGFNFAQALGKSPEMLRSVADFLTPSTKGAPVAYPAMQGPLINTPAGGVGSGLYGQTDLVGIEFFLSTSRL
jgi:hypothetical protein